MKVLFTTPILGYPPAGGPELRIANSIKALSKVTSLDILYRSSHEAELQKTSLNHYKEYCNHFEILYSQPSSRRQTLMRRAVKYLNGQLLDWQLDRIIKHVRSKRIELIWFGFGNISYDLISGFKRVMPHIPIVCDTDSVWSRFVLRELPYAKGERRRQIEEEGRKKEIEERAWTNLCEVTTAVSDIDAEYYRRLTNIPSKVHIFSNVVDLAEYKAKPSPPMGLKNPTLFLAGSFWNGSPMSMAAEWIVNEVFPLVATRYPDIQMYIVGRNSDREVGHLTRPGIFVTGQVDSVLPYLCNSNVALVPLRFESGTRFKILEAGACRVPIVSTTLGAEGLPVLDGKHILLADETEAFAYSILRILGNQDLAETLARYCFDLVATCYSLDSLSQEAEKILRFLTK